MFFLKDVPNINFMGSRKLAFIISGALIVLSLFSLWLRGLNLGIDFAGGTVFQVTFQKDFDVADIRVVLSQFGLGNSVIQKSEDGSFIIKTKNLGKEEQIAVFDALRKDLGELNILRIESVGPIIGEELRKQAFVALVIALLGILIYITLRFKFDFAVVSVLALIHDSLIVLGFYSLLWKEINLPFIAAILTIIGYSLNDTIVVLDRVRENLRVASRKFDFKTLINMSINQTLSRTINTSLTTLLPVLTLYLFGGEVLSNFALALLLGIIIGTYSSIYIAGALLVEWDLRRRRRPATLKVTRT
ncbi:MAG: protein translocase subunit SecF [Synergistetes bacterium]|nr:protein translocase subunit SecF [Synergistota bacterium]MCX8127240.1 protein translocase subunit SecF [Synergistota bacterium]MDW8191874.1 protein translocase subunit SecF [Synergistota bacterium]